MVDHLGREEVDLSEELSCTGGAGPGTWMSGWLTSALDLRKAPDSRCVVAPSPVWLRNHWSPTLTLCSPLCWE